MQPHTGSKLIIVLILLYQYENNIKTLKERKVFKKTKVLQIFFTFF